MRARQVQTAKEMSLAPSRRIAIPSVTPQAPVANLSNRMLQQLVQCKLRVSEPGDHEERQADAIADAVVNSGAETRIQRKCAGCAAGGTCSGCEHEEEAHRQVKAGPATVNANHSPALGTGQPLSEGTRSYFESRMGQEFGDVRVHTDSAAAESAVALSARAYTLGRDIVFGDGEYSPGTRSGDQLLAHELAHVVQQRHRSNGVIQRQFITPLAPGGGFGGLMERDRQRENAAIAAPPAPTPAATAPFQVCSRPLQSALGVLFNHAYVDAPPYRYAVISPLCTPTDGGSDDVLRGTAAQKFDNSPDPCGQSPVNCVDCNPAPGVTDVGKCLRDAFAAYNNPNLYKGLGPNSNTFAGTLARACCANMTPTPKALGWMPGWSDPPAPFRPARCPPGPTC